MIELEQYGIPEETEYESIDLDDESPDTSEAFSKLMRANYIDKAGFEPIPDENGFIEDKNAVSPDEGVLNHNLQDVTNSTLQLLSSREQQIVRMRYGLNETGKEYTLKEVGEVFRVTRERIRQIEEKALLKLRNPYPSNKLLDFASKN